MCIGMIYSGFRYVEKCRGTMIIRMSKNIKIPWCFFSAISRSTPSQTFSKCTNSV